MGKRVDQKKEKRLRNEEYAKRFRPRGKAKRERAPIDACRTKGHSTGCEFNTCPSWNP